MRLAALVVGLGAVSLSTPADAGDTVRAACNALPAMVSSSIHDFFSAIRSCAKEAQGSAALYAIAGTHHGAERRAIFDASGALIGLDETVNLESLPPPILAVLADRYAGLPILRVQKLRRATSVYYEIRIEKDGAPQDILFNGSGMRAA
jgi:hypothetical protein